MDMSIKEYPAPYLGQQVALHVARNDGNCFGIVKLAGREIVRVGSEHDLYDMPDDLAAEHLLRAFDSEAANDLLDRPLEGIALQTVAKLESLVPQEYRNQVATSAALARLVAIAARMTRIAHEEDRHGIDHTAEFDRLHGAAELVLCMIGLEREVMIVFQVKAACLTITIAESEWETNPLVISASGAIQ